MERLTVLHIFSGDLWAGAEVMIFNLLSRLHEEDHVKVVALGLNEGVLADNLRAVGVTTVVIPERSHSFAGILRRATRRLGHSPVDVIHAHRYKENLLGWLLAKRLGVRQLVTTIHGLPESAAGGLRAAGVARWRNRVNYSLLRTFGCVVAVSEEMKQVLVSQHGFSADRVRVIRNGVAVPAVSPERSRDGGFHVGTVGRMVPVKGFDLFLDLAARLRRESANVRFSLLGDGPLRETLQRQAAALNLQDCVEFLAPRSNPMPYYQSLDLYVNTSHHEGIPLSVLEAMGCGVPVVSSAVGGIPEIVTDGQHGFLVEGRQVERFAEPCLALMDEGLRRRLGERASAWVRAHFSAESMARAYRQLYEEHFDWVGAGQVVGASSTARGKGLECR